MQGWLKLHRKIQEWQWFDDPIVLKFFIYCITSANHKDTQWLNYDVDKGSFIRSVSSMEKDLKYSTKQVRTCMRKLQKSGEISVIGTNKFTIIEVCNFGSYQDEEDSKGTTGANKRANEGQSGGQTRGKPRATDKNEEKDKNEKNTTKGGKSYNGYSDEELEKDRLALESSSDVEKRQWNAFVEHMKKYPVINSFEKPITFRQFISLKQDFVEPNGSLMRLIDPVLADMELYYDSDSAKKRRVLHLCLRQFLRNRNVKQVVPTIEPIRRVK